MVGKSKKYYVVWVGVKPGVYDSWSECQAQIKGFPAAKYKSFKTKEQASKAFHESAADHVGVKKNNSNKKDKKWPKEVNLNSISVDAACSRNPGLVEYRGVITKSGEQIFHVGPLKEGTNNLGEFLALVHALAYLKEIDKENIPIYSDSRTAMAWVRNKKVKSTLKATSNNKNLFKLVSRALKWLENNQWSTKVMKWDTKNWGEIPADFGRK